MLPNGTFTLVFNLSSVPRHLFPPNLDGAPRRFRRAWVSGAHTRFILIDAVAGTSLMGVHFRPGGAARFLGVPAAVLRDSVEDLDGLWAREGERLWNTVVEAPNPRAKFEVLERELLVRHRTLPAPDALVSAALRQLTSAPHLARIDEVVAASGVSHARFIERFERTVGLSPKRYCRIARFQQVLRLLEHGKPVRWADLAGECGYYDQAHFIREFREFSGIVPTRYLTEKGEHMNYVPLPTTSVGPCGA
ncbi:MAG: helix-turn-helix transcriptional regulator [Verrucomicrobiales bacterium]|nr:helix-turn-helix transcriptional regulator [Verrucomicrobiales bacterium]